MTTATIDMISPTGTPISISVTKDADSAEIIAIMERADKIGNHFVGKGWAFASTQPATPSAAELDKGPTFCGFPCSSTVDELGRPSWIMANGRQAQRHEKQGDVWYSVKVGEKEFEQVLRLPKGEKVPAVKGL